MSSWSTKRSTRASRVDRSTQRCQWPVAAIVSTIARTNMRAIAHFVGVLGWPLDHTLSPTIHNAAFRNLGMDWVYLAWPVQPDQLGQAIGGLRALGAQGANVTMPHKESVIEHLDEISGTRAQGRRGQHYSKSGGQPRRSQHRCRWLSITSRRRRGNGSGRKVRTGSRSRGSGTRGGVRSRRSRRCAHIDRGTKRGAGARGRLPGFERRRGPRMVGRTTERSRDRPGRQRDADRHGRERAHRGEMA